ncbi:MAG: hypothetical protein MHM6MM_005689 [Cercozoa sp. M6MM]
MPQRVASPPVTTKAELAFATASQPDMIRALEKDMFYLSIVRDQVKHAASLLLGRRSTRWVHETQLLADLAYFGVTTIWGAKTPGEEYCDLLRVTGNPNRMRLPTLTRRGALVLLQVVLPYLWLRLRLCRLYESEDRWYHRLWNKLVHASTQSHTHLQLLQSVHLALFYIWGDYLEPAKRMANVRYAYLRRPTFSRIQYKGLGALIFVQLIIRGVFFLRERYRNLRSERERRHSVERGGNPEHSWLPIECQR